MSEFSFCFPISGAEPIRSMKGLVEWFPGMGAWAGDNSIGESSMGEVFLGLCSVVFPEKGICPGCEKNICVAAL